MQPTTERTLIKWLMLGGVGIVGCGATILSTFASARIVVSMIDLGAFLMVIGFGLEIASKELREKQTMALSVPQPIETDVALLKLTQELRRPLFPWLATTVAVCISMGSAVVGWRLKTFSPLFIFVFPSALIITVWLATLTRKHDALKQAFISQLSDAKRKIFLEFLDKHQRWLERGPRYKGPEAGD
jgi:hypothetical protein